MIVCEKENNNEKNGKEIHFFSKKENLMNKHKSFRSFYLNFITIFFS